MMAITRSSLSVLRKAAAPASALALTAVLGGTAMAQGAPAATPAAAPGLSAMAASADHAPVLTIRQVYDRLETAGYRDLREIEWDDYHYDVKGRNAQGARVKLEVDGQTGAVLRSRIKH